MKPLSLLQALSEAPAKAPIETKVEETATTQYLVYVVENCGNVMRIGVPLHKVEAFDSHFAEHPETLLNIDSLLENFEALNLG